MSAETLPARILTRVLGAVAFPCALAVLTTVAGNRHSSAADALQQRPHAKTPPALGKAFASPAPSRAVLRRLNRTEYEYTLRDLLHLPGLNVKEMLPDDGRANGYDKCGAGLEISSIQMAKYLEAADYASLWLSHPA